MSDLIILGASYGRTDVTNKVRSLIANDQLAVTANNQTFGDGWPGVQKTLAVIYRYSDQAPRTLVLTEGQSGSIARVGGPEAWHNGVEGEMNVLGAAYGRTDVTNMIKLLAAGNGLAFSANNATFGDTWPNVQKTLTLVYEYSNGNPVMMIVTENAPIMITPPLTILGATYGQADVTPKVRAAVQYDALVLAATNATFGDSWPNVQKALTVVYQYVPGDARVKLVVEGSTMTINTSNK